MTKPVPDCLPIAIDVRTLELRPLTPVAPACQLDPKTAAQIAIFRVMAEMTMYSIDVNSVVKGKGFKGREFTWAKIAFDSFFFEEDAAYPNASIVPEAETSYESEARGMMAEISEETVDRFAPGTHIASPTDAGGIFRIETELVKREDRSGVHAAIVSAFAMEPGALLPNRRVQIPEYFDRSCRLELLGVDEPTTPDLVKQGRWPLVARIRAQLPVAILTAAQPPLRRVTFRTKVVEAEQDV
jgi:hypothetical protein